MFLYCRINLLPTLQQYNNFITYQLYNLLTNIKMKIILITVGKTREAYLREGIDKYLKRLTHYTRLSVIDIDELKNTKTLTPEQQKTKEAELILRRITPLDHLILLDEKGLELTSTQFAAFINKREISSSASLVFVIGGPFGFDPSVYQRANEKISLSRLTFSHQMVRLFFVEQLYRAYSILKGEPYHHE
jgi:23S rRNA (pseudouridine1915-N3)-methyltransferase